MGIISRLLSTIKSYFTKRTKSIPIQDTEIYQSNYEKLRADLMVFNDYVYSKEPEEIIDYLVRVYNDIREDPNYYSYNPYMHELGMGGKGVVSNYNHFFRWVSQQIYKLADTDKQKKDKLMSLLPLKLHGKVHEEILNYQKAVHNYMDQTSGLRKLKVGSKWGYIDKEQKIIIKPQYDEADDFSKGVAKVNVNGETHFIDTKGKYVCTSENKDGDDE